MAVYPWDNWQTNCRISSSENLFWGLGCCVNVDSQQQNKSQYIVHPIPTGSTTHTPFFICKLS